jgi:tetratricopeptide (TPR) repeat protein
MKRQGIPELDEVRQWIESYVKRVANLRDERGRGVTLLALRDAIEEWLRFYESQGASVEPEWIRVRNFDALLEKNAALFLKVIGRRRLQEERKQVTPNEERWWWWLDRKVEEERKKRLKRTAAILGGVTLVLVALYFFVFRLPPREQQYLNTLTAAEQALQNQAFEDVLAHCQEAIAIFPERPIPYVVAAIAAEKLGRTNEAEHFRQSARALYEKEEDLFLEEAGWYFRAGMLKEAKGCIARVLRKDPENLTALNLLGSVYEAEDNVVEALKVYQLVLELAEKKNEITLIPVAKMKIGMLQLRLPLSLPLPSPSGE